MLLNCWKKECRDKSAEKVGKFLELFVKKGELKEWT